MTPKTASLKTIAQEAGLSVMAVSKALRNAADISESTKKKISEIAHRQGYIPNPHARALRSKSSNVIGLIWSQLITKEDTILFSSVVNSLNSAGLGVCVILSDGDGKKEDDTIIKLSSSGVDGLIMRPCPRLDRGLAASLDRFFKSKPVVLVENIYAGFRASRFRGSVLCDERNAAKNLTQILPINSKTKIIHLAGCAGDYRNEQQLAGLMEGFKKRGFLFNEDDIITDYALITHGFFSRLAAKNKSAKEMIVTATNSEVAMIAWDCYQEESKSQQLPVVHFCCLSSSDGWKKFHSKVTWDFKEIGIKAAGLFEAMSKGAIGRIVEIKNT